jgi:hypothetical protein
LNATIRTKQFIRRVQQNLWILRKREIYLFYRY